ncbi:MAG: hypothetical protein JNM56_09245 [Planctomycetia bacterium]|nr:hypothetical protein [Planctomycetia bacterium]
MYASQLKSLLDDDGLTLDNIPKLSSLTIAWFRAEPSIATFILRSVLQDLLHSWYDPQGIPVAEYTPFHEKLLPALTRVAQVAVSGDHVLFIKSAEELVPLFHACMMAVEHR